MNKLRRYSLISTTRIEGSSIFSVHRQVKRHIRHRLTSAQLQKAFDWTLKRLRQLFPRQSPYAEPLSDSIPECGMCISHIIALNHAAILLKDNLQQPEMMAQLLQDGATYLWARGLLEEGKSLHLQLRTSVSTFLSVINFSSERSTHFTPVYSPTLAMSIRHANTSRDLQKIADSTSNISNKPVSPPQLLTKSCSLMLTII